MTNHRRGLRMTAFFDETVPYYAQNKVPYTWTVDLGQVYLLSEIATSFYIRNGSESYYQYKLKGSNDKVNWTMLADRSDNSQVAFCCDKVCGKYRYVQIEVTGVFNDHNNQTTASWANGLYEVQVFAEELEKEFTQIPQISLADGTYIGTQKQGLQPQEAVLESLSISREPEKKIYEQGESFDPAGLEVIATYSDGTSKVVTDEAELTGFNPDSPGEQTVQAAYQGQTAVFSVKVIKKLDRIEVTAPAKTEYQLGEEFSSDGMQVSAVYTDGSQEDVTKDAVCTGYHADAAGEQVIRVEYEGKAATFTVYVMETQIPDTGYKWQAAAAEALGKYAVGEDAGAYTADSWNAYQAAYQTIQNLQPSGSYTEDEMNAWIAALKEAYNSLKKADSTTQSGNTVYAKEDGRLAVHGTFSAGGSKYFAKKSGAVAKGQFCRTKSGNKVYAQKNGKLAVNKIVKTGGKRYFAKKSGAIAVKTWVKAGKRRYYCNASGVITKVKKA